MPAPSPISFGNSTRHTYVRVDQGDSANGTFRIVGFFTSYDDALLEYSLDNTMAITFRELLPQDKFFVVHLYYSHVDTNSLFNYGRMYTSYYEKEYSELFFFEQP